MGTGKPTAQRDTTTTARSSPLHRRRDRGGQTHTHCLPAPALSPQPEGGETLPSPQPGCPRTARPAPAPGTPGLPGPILVPRTARHRHGMATAKAQARTWPTTGTTGRGHAGTTGSGVGRPCAAIEDWPAARLGEISPVLIGRQLRHGQYPPALIGWKLCHGRTPRSSWPMALPPQVSPGTDCSAALP